MGGVDERAQYPRKPPTGFQQVVQYAIGGQAYAGPLFRWYTWLASPSLGNLAIVLDNTSVRRQLFGAFQSVGLASGRLNAAPRQPVAPAINA